MCPLAELCAVFSGDGIALLLTPGTGVCKPAVVDGAMPTDGDGR